MGDSLFDGLSTSRPPEPGAPSLCADPALAGAVSSHSADLVGEIRLDHRRDLGRALDLAVSEAAAVGDADLLLRAWCRWGAGCFERIEGDFAVAIWDRSERRLILARDALGQRPLFYTRVRGGIAFASLPLPLAALNGQPRPNLTQLAAYLTGMPEDDEASYIVGVQRVLPGHFLAVNHRTRIEQHCWWTPDCSPLTISHDDALEAVSSEIRRAVDGMLATEAPVIGADLSSGFDSSIVITTAAAIEPRRLIAYSAAPAGPVDSPPDGYSDEAKRAAETARMNGVRQITVAAVPESPLTALERWLPTTQAPILNACNLGWIDACYAAARELGADAYLTGGRGNFTVTRPGLSRIEQLATTGRYRALAAELPAYRRFTGASWPGVLAMAFGSYVPSPLWNRIVPPASRRADGADVAAGALLRPAHPAVRESLSRQQQGGDIAALFADESAAARLRVAQSVDDGSSWLSVHRRHGLDLREPLSARRVIELCMRLPTDHFFRDGIPRRLARDLLRGKVPESIVNERHRGWQGANWRAGFEPALPEMLAEVERIGDDSELSAMLDVDRIRTLLRAWPSHGWNDWAQIELYRNTLFRAIGAARFVRFVREWTPSA